MHLAQRRGRGREISSRGRAWRMRALRSRLPAARPTRLCISPRSRTKRASVHAGPFARVGEAHAALAGRARRAFLAKICTVGGGHAVLKALLSRSSSMANA